MSTATCATCGTGFEVPAQTAAKYPGWTPSACPACYRASRGGGGRGARRRKGGAGGGARRAGSAVQEALTVAEVLDRYDGGPQDGVFTDGSASPNPGPGGWGAVYVVAGEVVEQAHGHDPATTNNRMELQAIAAGLELVPPGTPATLWSDSELAVKTLTEWAHGWAARGWRRKGGEIKNLDLVRPLFEAVRARPEIELRWIAAHAGNRWNEYADALSTAWMREHL